MTHSINTIASIFDLETAIAAHGVVSNTQDIFTYAIAFGITFEDIFMGDTDDVLDSTEQRTLFCALHAYLGMNNSERDVLTAFASQRSALEEYHGHSSCRDDWAWNLRHWVHA